MWDVRGWRSVVDAMDDLWRAWRVREEREKEFEVARGLLEARKMRISC